MTIDTKFMRDGVRLQIVCHCNLHFHISCVSIFKRVSSFMTMESANIHHYEK